MKKLLLFLLLLPLFVNGQAPVGCPACIWHYLGKIKVDSTVQFVSLRGANTAGKFLTTDDSGKVIAVTGSGGGGAVNSVFGRTGTVIATSGDYTTTLVTEGTNQYFTNGRAVTALTGQNVSIFTNDAGYTTNSTSSLTNYYTKTASDARYLQGNQTITLSGDASGSGATSIAVTLATVNSNVGTFGSATQVPQFAINAKGLMTAVGNVTITPAFSSITGKPTTVSGYGITDVPAQISLTTTGSSGAATYNQATGALNIPQYAGNAGTVTSVAQTVPASLLSISGSPVTTSGTLAIGLANAPANSAWANLTGSSTAPSYSQATTINTPTSLMVRDANQACEINQMAEGIFAITTGGTTTTFTNATPANIRLTGSSNQTIKLPDATTCDSGTHYFIVNNSTGTITINDNTSSLLTTLYPNMRMQLKLFDVSTAAGVWRSDRSIDSIHVTAPSVFTSPVEASYSNRTATIALTYSGTALPIANGGTGSTTQNFVDLSTTQASIAGAKTFTTSVTTPTVNYTSTVTSVNCATSGTAEFSESIIGSTQFITIVSKSCLGNAAYTNPTPYTVTPNVFGNSVTTVATTTTTTITGTGATQVFGVQGR